MLGRCGKAAIPSLIHIVRNEDEVDADAFDSSSTARFCKALTACWLCGVAQV
jgi:hypothetical protein